MAIRPISLSRLAPRAPAEHRLLRRLEQRSATIGTRLCDALYDVVPFQHERDARRNLISLKRSIFNTRALSEDDLDSALRLPGLPRRVRRLIRGWAISRRLITRQEVRFAAALRADRLELRRVLRQALEDRQFVRTLAFASPALRRQIVAQFSGKCPSPDALESWEVSLLAYIARAEYKTTPFGGFVEVRTCLLGVGSPASSSPAVVQESIEPSAELFCCLDWATKDLPTRTIRLNPTVLIDEFGIWLLPTGPSAVAFRKLPDDPVLAMLVTALQQDRRARRGAAIAADLAEGLGLSSEVASSLVKSLLAAELIEPTPFHPAGIDSLDALARELPERAQSVAALKATLRDSLESPDVLVDALRATFLSDGDVAKASLGGDDRRSSRLVHQSLRVREAGTAPGYDHDAILSALGTLAGLMPLFDTVFPAQCELVEPFIAEYGADARVSLRRAFHLFKETKAHRPLSPATTAWNEARAALLGDIRKATLSDDPEPYCLSDELIAKHALSADRFRKQTPFSSVSWTGQQSEEAATRFVLNKVAAGYGSMLAHWLPDSGDQVDAMRHRLADIGPGYEAVELVGSFGFDGQRRPQITARAIGYPGEPLGERKLIDLSDTAVCYDRAQNRLRLLDCASGSILVPIHCGTLSPNFLPPFFRWLRLLGGTIAPDFPLLEMLEMNADDCSAADIRRYRRISVGNVVVLRRSWCIAHRETPFFNDNASDRYRAVQDWVGALGLPQHVFVTPMLTAELVRAGVTGRRFNRMRKSVPVDWQCEQSVALLCRYLHKGGGTMIVSEVLPDYRPGTHACEQIYETWS